MDIREKIENELPENPYNYEDECRESTAYSKAQWDMIRAGYRKIEGKPPVLSELSDEEIEKVLEGCFWELDTRRHQGCSTNPA